MDTNISSRDRYKGHISIIASLYNLSTDIEPLYRSLITAMKDYETQYEIIFVDDGSTDDTYKRLGLIAQSNARVKVVKMRSQFGEASTLNAGLQYSTGECILFMSGRVRINPQEIPKFINELKNGKDLIVGWRYPRRDSLLNRLISCIFNRLVSGLSGQRLHDINSGFFITYRSVIERIVYYGDLYNFIPILVSQQGYSITEKQVEQLPGKFRKSKYPLEYIQRFLDIISVFFLIRYFKKPIHLLGLFGSVFVISGLVIEIYLFIYRILQLGGIAGRPLLILGGLLLVIGIQMISIGLIGEMIIFTHAGDIEEYNIEEVINE